MPRWDIRDHVLKETLLTAVMEWARVQENQSIGREYDKWSNSLGGFELG